MDPIENMDTINNNFEEAMSYYQPFSDEMPKDTFTDLLKDTNDDSGAALPASTIDAQNLAALIEGDRLPGIDDNQNSTRINGQLPADDLMTLMGLTDQDVLNLPKTGEQLMTDEEFDEIFGPPEITTQAIIGNEFDETYDPSQTDGPMIMDDEFDGIYVSQPEFNFNDPITYPFRVRVPQPVPADNNISSIAQPVPQSMSWRRANIEALERSATHLPLRIPSAEFLPRPVFPQAAPYADPQPASFVPEDSDLLQTVNGKSGAIDYTIKQVLKKEGKNYFVAYKANPRTGKSKPQGWIRPAQEYKIPKRLITEYSAAKLTWINEHMARTGKPPKFTDFKAKEIAG